jgi:hypothetical protein
MSAWSHLSNAHHIDWVIESFRTYPEMWITSKTLADGGSAVGAGPVLGQGPAACAAMIEINLAKRDTILRVAWAEIRGPVGWHCSAWSSQSAILALIAYDDCAHLLDMPNDRLKAWALLTEQPAAWLLLPAAIACEQIRELNMT